MFLRIVCEIVLRDGDAFANHERELAIYQLTGVAALLDVDADTLLPLNKDLIEDAEYEHFDDQAAYLLLLQMLQLTLEPAQIYTFQVRAGDLLAAHEIDQLCRGYFCPALVHILHAP